MKDFKLVRRGVGWRCYRHKRKSGRYRVVIQQEDVDIPKVSETFQPSIEDTFAKYNDETNYGSLEYMRIGYENVSSQNRAFFKFDIDLPSNILVLDATLYLYIYNDQTIYSCGTFYLYRIIESWSENNITWSNQPSTSPSESLSISPSTISTGWLDMTSDTITSDVRYFIENPGENYGWMLRGSSGDPCYFDVYSSEYSTDTSLRPKLIVDYYVADTPTPHRYLPNVVSNYDYWLEFDHRGFSRPSYMEVIETLMGVSYATVYLPDSTTGRLRAEMEDYLWEPTWIYGRSDGSRRLLLHGILEKVGHKEQEDGTYVIFNIPSYAVYTMIRQRNTSYSNQEVSEIMKEIVTQKISEVEASQYVHPTGTVLTTFNAYNWIFDNFNDLAQRATADTGEQWRWYICNGNHYNESKPNLHLEKVKWNYYGHEVRPEYCINYALTRGRPKANRVRLIYNSGGSSVTVNDTASQSEDWGVVEETIWNDIITDSGEASDYANSILEQVKDPRYSGYAVVKGSLKWKPGILARVSSVGYEQMLGVKEVRHRFTADQGYTTMLVFVNP